MGRSNLDWKNKHLIWVLQEYQNLPGGCSLEEQKALGRKVCDVRKILIISKDWKVDNEARASLAMESTRGDVGEMGTGQVIQDLTRHVNDLTLFFLNAVGSHWRVFSKGRTWTCLIHKLFTPALGVVGVDYREPRMIIRLLHFWHNASRTRVVTVEVEISSVSVWYTCMIL